MAFTGKEAKHINLNINNFRLLSPNNNGDVETRMTRAAERNNLPRIGKLDLYEEPEDVINHYKDAGFDIVEEMDKRKGNFLWVRARAIDADVANENGDYFSWEELIKEREIQSDRNKTKIAAYKSFEGVPIYTNHENSDIQKAKGKVVFAELDEKERCVYCTFYIDADAYPDIAKSIQMGTITDVSMGCFPAGTPVMTENGYRLIEEIQPNELLVDGEGNLTKIRNKQEVKYSGPLVAIEIEGGPVIRCTPNHPLLKIKKQDKCLCGCDEKLEEPKNKKKSLEKRFKRGHHQNIYNSMSIYASEDVDKINKIKEQKGNSETQVIEAGDLEIGDYLVSPIGGEIKPTDINEDLARLIGYFLAEGCLKYRDDNFYAIEFCFSIEEKNTLAAEVIEILRKHFNINPSTQERIDKNNYVVYTSDKTVSNFLLYHCNRYSYGKKIKPELLFANNEIQKHIVGAWLSGDGYLKTLPNEQEPSTIQGTTVSKELLEQMSFILNRLGIYHTTHTIIEGKYNKLDISRSYPENFKGINSKRIAYCINIPSAYAREIIDYCSFRNNNYRFSQRNGHRNTDKYLLRKISNITTVDYDGLVYNFEVENDDHTYLVDNEIISHNCQVEYSYCSICGNKAEKESEWCVTGDTLITMSDGTLKRIDKIEKEDKILTHLGNSKSVLEVMEREVNEDILTISSPLTFSPLNITKNHPMWVVAKEEINCKRCTRQKCRPGEIGICYASQIKGDGEQTCFSNDKVQEFKFIESELVNVEDLVETPILHINENIGIDNGLATLIGYYLSEGSIIFRNNIPACLEFSIADNEVETIGESIVNLCKTISNEYTPKIYRKTGFGNSASIRYTNYELAKYMVENCSGNARTKKISNNLINQLNRENIYCLLGAFIDGDGYQSHSARPGAVRIDIASPNLAAQLRLLLNSVGIRSSYLHTTQKGGPTSRDQRFDIYCLSVPAGDLEQMNKYSQKITEFSDNKKFKGYWTERGLAQPISDIQEVHYVGKVYNLEVEDDNSYIANGISVHNCNHLKERKGKKFSGVVDKGKRKGQKVQNELVYEDNKDLKFIELSIVSDGAFSNCTIGAILPYQEVLTEANQLKCTASNIKEVVAQNIKGLMQKRATSSNLELIDYLDSSQDILAKIEAFSSAIINNLPMQKEASMNKVAFMNVLDTLNDVLNKIEAVIISLLGRKDNIDLAHVAKISKAMADLQQVISDLIDDGVGTLSDAVNFQQSPQQEQAGGQPAVAQQDYTSGGNVGRVMGMETGNMQTQPVANVIDNGGMSAVPFQFTPNLEPPGFQQLSAGANKGWLKFANNLQDANVKLGSIVNSLDIKEITPEKTQGGISTMSNKLNERISNALMNKIATVVEQPIIASRENGKFKVVISDRDGEEISGYYDDHKTDWQPSSLTMEDIDLIRENRVASVTHKLVDEFMGFVKEAGWKPETPKGITREEQLAPYRTGNPSDVQEEQISSKREGNPSDVQEEQLSSKREGNPEDKTEHRLQEDSATVWGRKGNPSDVQEEQLSDIRIGTDCEVWEHKLESRRSSTSENKVATAALNALACTICDSGASPSEVLEIATKAIEDENFVTALVAQASPNSYKARTAKRERVELELEDPTYKNIPTAFVERMADVLVEDEGIALLDIKTALSSIVSAPKEGMKKLLGKFAREQAHNVRLSSSGEKTRDDLIKGAVYAAMSDAYDEPLDRSHLKVALFAVAETAIETQVTPDEIFEVIENISDDQNALVTLETERLPNAMASRIKDKERQEFWGRKASSYTAPDIEKTLFASLADYAEAMEGAEKKELPSHLIWQVAKKLAQGGENSRILVDAAIQARTDNSKLTRDAASLTDRTDTIREIRLSMDELPGVDPSSDEFAETVRDYTIAFLQNKGYRVDPETFNFTKLTVNDHAREVVAIVQSSIIKEFGDEDFSIEESGMGMPEEFSSDMEPLLTPMAIQQRKNRREALIREAQAAPMGGGAPMGGAPAAGGMEAPMGGVPEAPGGGPGLSSLLGGEDSGMDTGMEEESNLDNASSPGQIKPIGSICPACGSTNVDLASSKGECSDCHTKFDLSVSISNIVTPEESEGLPEGEGGVEEEIPEGLGAALAPAGAEAGAGIPGAPPAAPAAPEMGGGMPMAASVSWYGNAEQFVKLAKKKSEGFTDEQVPGPKPPGTVCIACGNKQVRRAKSQYFCDACGTIGKIGVKESKKYDDKLIFSVSYLLPPLS